MRWGSVRSSKPVYDFGSVIVGVIAAGAALIVIHVAVIAWINDIWPPLPAAERQRAALIESHSELDRISRPSVLLTVSEADVAPWFPDAFMAAVAQAQEKDPALRALRFAEPYIAFAEQGIRVGAKFEFDLPDHDVTVIGAVEGLGFVGMQGEWLTMLPTVERLKVTEIRGDDFWFLKPLKGVINGLLLSFRDNINGQIPAYKQRLPIAPLTRPGEPRTPMPIQIPDPTAPGGQRQLDFLPPILEAAALLIEPKAAHVLAQLALDPRPQPTPTPRDDVSYRHFHHDFVQRAAVSGFLIEPWSGFRIDDVFLRALLDRFLKPVAAMERVAEAVRGSIEDVAKLVGPHVALTVDPVLAREAITAAAKTGLDEWSKQHPVQFAPTEVAIAPQHVRLGQQFTADLSDLRAQLTGRVTVLAPFRGGSGRLEVRPAIDEFSVIDLKAQDFSDLAGLMAGLNRAVAIAINAVNGAIPPQQIDLPLPRIEPIDFRKIAIEDGSIEVTPPVYTPPAITWQTIAVLLDSDKLLLMGDWSASGMSHLPPPAAAPPPQGTVQEQHAELTRRFLERWIARFGSHAPDPSARAMLHTERLAEYLNTAWRQANFRAAARGRSEDRSSRELELDLSWSCGCDYDCEWWEAWCHAEHGLCEIAKLALCNVLGDKLLEAAEWLFGRIEVNLAMGTSWEAFLSDTSLTMREDFRHLQFSGILGGGADMRGTIRVIPKDGAVLRCIDRSWSIPTFGPLHAEVPRRGVPLSAAIDPVIGTGPGGNPRLTLAMNFGEMNVDGKLSPVPINALAVELVQLALTCPVDVVAALGLIASLPANVGLLAISIAALAQFTDGEARELIEKLIQNNETLRRIMFGDFREKFKLGSTEIHIDAADVRVFDKTFTALARLENSIFEMRLNPKP